MDRMDEGRGLVREGGWDMLRVGEVEVGEV